jgi:hypothetical protein
MSEWLCGALIFVDTTLARSHQVSDLELRQDVLDELEFEPRIDAAHIGVTSDRRLVSSSISYQLVFLDARANRID